MSIVTSLLGPLLTPLFEDAVDRRVPEAVEEHLARASHVPPNDLLEHQLVYGDRGKLHIHSTAVLNNALFNLCPERSPSRSTPSSGTACRC